MDFAKKKKLFRLVSTIWPNSTVKNTVLNHDNGKKNHC